VVAVATYQAQAWSVWPAVVQASQTPQMAIILLISEMVVWVDRPVRELDQMGKADTLSLFGRIERTKSWSFNRCLVSQFLRIFAGPDSFRVR
jgi:hypothetical protein